MAKFLITTIQVNLCCLLHVSLGFGTKFTLLLLKILPLAYHHSHFLAATLDFTSFTTMAFLGLHIFFYSWAVLDLISLLFVIAYCIARILPSLNIFCYLCFFSFCRYQVDIFHTCTL